MLFKDNFYFGGRLPQREALSCWPLERSALIKMKCSKGGREPAPPDGTARVWDSREWRKPSEAPVATGPSFLLELVSVGQRVAVKSEQTCKCREADVSLCREGVDRQVAS